MSETTCPADYTWFVGIDWGSQHHQVCIMGVDGKVVEERSVLHSGAALAELGTRLASLGDGQVDRVAVAIEMPRDAVVEGLVERGIHVYSINPKQLDRFRDRHTVGGAKDDRRDAQVLARSLRTDLPSFRRVRLDDPLVIQLRELSRMDDELEDDLGRSSNRLYALLVRYFPSVLALCPGANEPWLWALLAKVPTPAHAKRLKASVVTDVLRKHRIRRVDTDGVLRALREMPVPVAPGVVEAASQHVLALLPRLELLHQQRRDVGTRIEQLLEQLAAEPEPGQQVEHRDVQILLSFVGVGKNVAATMLAEASQPLADRDYHALRLRTGVAPVTRQSGKKCVVVMRRACNPRLRDAAYHWGRVAAIYDPPSRERYIALRARGHSHGRAVRSVVDRLLRVLVAALTTGTLYRRELAAVGAA